MKINLQKNLKEIGKIVLIAVVAGVGVGVALAWTSPSQTPPNGNVALKFHCPSEDMWDSGWVAIPADKMGADVNLGITMKHNLGTTDTVVYLEGNDDQPNGFGVSNQEEGGVAIVGQGSISGWYGGWWGNKTANTIKVYAGDHPSGWSKVHLIIWKKSCL